MGKRGLDTADLLAFDGAFVYFYPDCEVKGGSLHLPDGRQHLLTSLKPALSPDGALRYAMVADQVEFTKSAVFAEERKRLVLSSILTSANETSKLVRYALIGLVVALLWFSNSRAGSAAESALLAQQNATKAYEKAVEIKTGVDLVQQRLNQPILVQQPGK